MNKRECDDQSGLPLVGIYASKRCKKEHMAAYGLRGYAIALMSSDYPVLLTSLMPPPALNVVGLIFLKNSVENPKDAHKARDAYQGLPWENQDGVLVAGVFSAWNRVDGASCRCGPMICPRSCHVCSMPSSLRGDLPTLAIENLQLLRMRQSRTAQQRMSD